MCYCTSSGCKPVLKIISCIIDSIVAYCFVSCECKLIRNNKKCLRFRRPLLKLIWDKHPISYHHLNNNVLSSWSPCYQGPQSVQAEQIECWLSLRSLDVLTFEGNHTLRNIILSQLIFIKWLDAWMVDRISWMYSPEACWLISVLRTRVHTE